MIWVKETRTLLMVLLFLLDLSAGREPRGHVRRHAHRHRERQPQQNITLAVILPQSSIKYPWAWPRVGPAVERAIRTINSDPSLLPYHNLTYIFKSSEDERGICSESVASLEAVDLKWAYDPWAFIGPGCTYTAAPVGMFTAHWEVPMITAGAPAVGFYDGYPSVTNTGPTHKKLGRFSLRICQKFEWTQHVILMFGDEKEDDRPCYFTIEGLYAELNHVNISAENSVFEENKKSINYSQILSDILNAGRGESNILPHLVRRLHSQLA